jgi:predicted phage terminase large subunit-like protein
MLEFLDRVTRLERRLDRYLPAPTSRQFAGQPSIDWSLPTIELVPFLDPTLEAPMHLAQYGSVLDEVMDQEAREAATTFRAIALSAPPQHGKTKTTECAIIKLLKTCHGLSHAYATYAQKVTDRIERETRRIAEACGLVIEGTQTQWWIPETRSSIRWTSVGGPLTSDPVDGLLVVDDPFKDFAQARSEVEREKRWDWLVGVALRRLHPGAWLVEMATRWHEDDLTARMLERLGVECLNIQGICEDENDGTGRKFGEPLWPEERPLEFLEQQKQGDPLSFEAQYQGRPRSLGDALFGPVHFYDELPPSREGYREAYGTDLAYSEKTSADWSVSIRGRKAGGKLYVTHGIRQRKDSVAFLEDLKVQQSECRAPVRWYHGGGGELGVSRFYLREVPELRALPASEDKVVRSTALRKGWNLGNVLLPSQSSQFYGPWVEDLIQECKVFTGVSDAHDDHVDALAALYDELGIDSADVKPRAGKRRELSGGLGGF